MKYVSIILIFICSEIYSYDRAIILEQLQSQEFSNHYVLEQKTPLYNRFYRKDLDNDNKVISKIVIKNKTEFIITFDSNEYILNYEVLDVYSWNTPDGHFEEYIELMITATSGEFFNILFSKNEARVKYQYTLNNVNLFGSESLWAVDNEEDINLLLDNGFTQKQIDELSLNGSFKKTFLGFIDLQDYIYLEKTILFQ